MGVKFNKNSVFKIIELLIVVVVIAALIGIGTVVYSGVVSRANTVNLLSDLDANSGTLRLYFTSYGSYPTALDANRCPSAPTADTGFCLKLSSGNTLTSYSGSSANFELIISNGSLSYVVTPNTVPTFIPTTAGPTISSIYSGYDLLFCRFATNCSGVSGISSDFSYQVAFTAKAGSKYSVNMLQVDNTSTNWTSGTAITTNITYSTPTVGASLSSNIITTTNAGETRVTFTGTGLLDKTLIVRLTEVDNNNSAISQSTHTKALGVYTTVGSYTLTAPASATVNYLVVAGGGGGGSLGGGGGAGGHLSGSLSISTGVFSSNIIVGTNGLGATAGASFRGSNGSNSVFSTITATGGGGGGADSPNAGLSGGSGGGGGNAGAAGSATAGQGNAGGGSTSASAGNGGGGAGSAGSNAVSGTFQPGTPGAGGSGLATTITGSSVLRSGGGGGGGRWDASTSVGSGGSGGSSIGGNGGTSTNSIPATSGTSNTGSGGGGGGYGGSPSGYFPGANGGSGIVIFRTT